MNEQIEKLAKKAGMVMYPTGLGISENTLWGDHNISKLAELIVGECVSICEEHPAWTGRMIGEQIKQHFGVA
jgi:hypothetical protein